jgi:cytidylate kinase
LNINTTKKLVIAIDGPAASGKSTTARLVAQHLGYIYIDTGAMYRAVTLAILRKEISLDDQAAITAIAKNVQIELKMDQKKLKTFLDGEDVSEAIRKPEIDEVISLISSYKSLRDIMVDKQRRIAESGGIVMDGRDIGTVVLPDAHIKIFMKANLASRARRRYDELHEKGIVSSLNRIRDEIEQRDHYDSTRENSPLKSATDAHILDTTNLTIDEQVRAVLDIFNGYKPDY